MRYRWPDGQQCAVVLSFDVDAESGFLFREPEKSRRSLAGLEERRFGPRVGVDRILRMLDQLRLPATFFIPGWTVENPRAPVLRISTPDRGNHHLIVVEGRDMAPGIGQFRRHAQQQHALVMACDGGSHRIGNVAVGP